MSRTGTGAAAAAIAIATALTGAAAALASDGPGGGSGGGGGTCVPLVMPLKLVHPRSAYSLVLSATIKNCATQNESWEFAVYFEQDPTPIYSISTGGAVQRPRDSLTLQIGSFGGELGETETFTGVLTRTGTGLGVISKVTSTATFPTTPPTP